MKLIFHLNIPAEEVFECLTDMQRFVASHPVIQKAEPLSEHSYLVHETLRPSGIPFTF